MTMSLEIHERPLLAPERIGAVDRNPLFAIAPRGDTAERNILVAEDDPTCRRALRHYLSRSGYLVSEATSVVASLEAAARHPADLVILDLDQGGGTVDALTRLRRHSSVPVIVCSARATERDRVSLFNLGADDFMTKPYSFAELEARVRAVLRRGNNTPATMLDHGALLIDQGTRTVSVEGTVIPMTCKELTCWPSWRRPRAGCSPGRTSSSGSGAPTGDGRGGPR